MQATCVELKRLQGSPHRPLHICAHCDSASEGACREEFALSSLKDCR